MRSTVFVLALVTASVLHAQQPAQQAVPPPDDPVKTIVSRLDLEKYKATIKGLTQFGDRRQGTARNRAALDWIEAQLKSYGCANVERLTYTFTPRTPGQRGTAAAGSAGRGGTETAQRGGGRGQADPTQGQGGSRIRGVRRRTGVNSDP